MAKEKSSSRTGVPENVTEYLSKIGRKGGKAKVPKGFAKLSSKERKAIAKKAAEQRWANKREKALAEA